MYPNDSFNNAFIDSLSLVQIADGGENILSKRGKSSALYLVNQSNTIMKITLFKLIPLILLFKLSRLESKLVIHSNDHQPKYIVQWHQKKIAVQEGEIQYSGTWAASGKLRTTASTRFFFPSIPTVLTAAISGLRWIKSSYNFKTAFDSAQALDQVVMVSVHSSYLATLSVFI